MSNDIPYEPMKEPTCLEKILIGIMMVISAVFLRPPKGQARRKHRG